MISIVIPVYNEHKLTKDCVDSVRTTMKQEYEIILIDNGSSPPLKKPYTGFVPCRVIRNESNLGFPAAVNQGIRAATGDVIILLNNDVVVTDRWAELLVNALAEYSIVGPTCNYCAGKQRVKVEEYATWTGLNKQALLQAQHYGDHTEEVNWVIGFCMAFRKSLYDEIGEFDESIWPASGEEIDFCLRAKEAGHRVGIVYGCYVHHEGSQTFKSMEKAGEADYAEVCEKAEAFLRKKWGKDIYIRQSIHEHAAVHEGGAKILITARFVSGDVHEGGSSRYMKCLGETLYNLGHSVTMTSDPRECADELWDYIICSHREQYANIMANAATKLYISHGIIEDEQYQPGADGYISVSEETRKSNLERGIDSRVIGQPIHIGKWSKPNTELKNILVIRRGVLVEDQFAFLSEKYNLRISDMNIPIEDQIAWADVCITLGRGALEAMAQGKPVLIADCRRYIGAVGDGYVTKDNIADIAECNFSGRRYRHPLSREWIEAELAKYNHEDSAFLRRYVTENHDAKMIASQMIEYGEEIRQKKPTLTLVRQEYKLGIGIPLSFPMVPGAFFDSFLAMDKPPFYYLRSSNGPVDAMRNNLIREAMSVGCTHIIMMDTDQIYQQDTISRLMGHKKQIVACLVYRRYPPFDPLMLRGELTKYQVITEWTPGELVEVDATGTGCIMYEMSVFRNMPPPWFHFRTSASGPVGEDIGFCWDLRRAGYQIYVDTGCVAGHLTQMIVNDGTWKLYNKVKEVEAAHAIEHGVVKNKQVA